MITSVTPFALGIELADGDVDEILPKGSSLPTSRSSIYTTSVEHQRFVIISVCEVAQPSRGAIGTERSRQQPGAASSSSTSMNADHNANRSRIGKFQLAVPAAPVGVPKIEVTFSLTSEGLLFVSAKDLKTEKETTIRIESVNMSAEEREALKKRQRVKRATAKVLEVQKAATSALPPSARRDALLADCSATLRVLHHGSEEEQKGMNVTIAELQSRLKMLKLKAI